MSGRAKSFFGERNFDGVWVERFLGFSGVWRLYFVTIIFDTFCTDNKY
jgi:hypothetical protein